MIKREAAIALLRKYIKTENTIKHMLATEAIMKTLSQRLEPEKEDLWAMAGLLHDIDYEVAEEKEHCLQVAEILTKEGVDVSEGVLYAIQAHGFNLHPQFEPKSKMDWSLFISDSLTGLIVATALVRPDKKLSSVKVKSVMKKFKDKSFAKGTRREDIKMCEEKLGFPLKEFVEIGLKAMQGISDEIGL